MSETAILLEDISKSYQLGVIGTGTFYGDIKRWWAIQRGQPDPYLRIGEVDHGNREGKTLWALKDINFEVRQGEALGIIGRNGAGKSTLLKILSQVTSPTTGAVKIKGKIASLLEVGTGFHPELTGRENVYLNGAIMGMNREEVRRKFDEIVEFSGVEQFIDTPVKRYSSGMYVRLAFAVAAHLEPEILLIDEVLAVGDAQFQKKCLGKMGEVVLGGRTVLFVSHNMAAVNAVCDRAILLESGIVRMDDTAATVTNHYLSQDLASQVRHIRFDADESLGAQILEAEITEEPDPEGRETVLFRCRYAIRKPLENILLCVDVQNLLGTSVFYSKDEQLLDERKRQHGIHDVVLKIPKYLLAPGTYSIAFGFWEPGRVPEHFPNERLSFHQNTPIDRLAVHGISWPSVIYMPSTWSYIHGLIEEKNE
jgi:lipopolysaccharide transport system ATP-binding protein